MAKLVKTDLTERSSWRGHLSEGLPASARRQRAAPGTTFTPITLENFGGLIRGLGLYEEIDFCWTTARTSSFLTKSFPESRLPRFSHTFPPARTAFEGRECSGDEEYSARCKCQWHKGGEHEGADNTRTNYLRFDRSQ